MQKHGIKIKYTISFLWLPILTLSCMDYVRTEKDLTLSEAFSLPPVIDTKHLSPHPSRLAETINIGKNCKGYIFKAPIEDRNKQDHLYYLWFIDNKLAWPQSVIKPEPKNTIIARLYIDEQFLMSHYNNKIPKGFFERLHVIELFVSDVEYTIPESRYIDDEKENNEKEHSDYAYWIVSFSNDPC